MRNMTQVLTDLRSRMNILERRLNRLGRGPSTPVPLPIYWDHNYAPDRTGTLPTSEAASMLVVERVIPSADYDRMLRGQFTAWFGGNTAAGNKTYYAGVQIIEASSTAAHDSHETAGMVFTDTVNASRSLNVPFERLIPAGQETKIRMLQWGTYTGTTTVVDGNGICFAFSVV